MPRPVALALLILLLALIPVGSYVGYIRFLAPMSSGSHGVKSVSAAPLITPGKDSITCVHGVAWSPDGSLLAIVGQKDSCYNFRAGAQGEGHLVIYDVATGHGQLTLAPDDLVKSNGNQVIYGAMAWSPDGKQLAVGYTIGSIGGTLVLNRDGSVAHLFSYDSHFPVSKSLWEPYAHTEHRPFISAVWDTATGKVAPTPPNPSSSAMPAYTFAQALSYQWGSEGQLQAATPIPTAPSQSPGVGGPVGSPATGQPFTLWQPGELLWTPVNLNYPPNPRGAFLWHSTFVAWSPDGRYIAQDMAVQAALVPSDLFPLSANELSAVGQVGHMDFTPAVLPIRDMALAAVLKAAPRVEGDQENPGHIWTLELAWRPDGRYLAAYMGSERAHELTKVPEDESRAEPGYGGQPVQIFDCSTGKVVATLTPQAGEGHFNTGTDWLLWSADGTHLLRVDSSLGTITVWGPDQLPR